MKRTELEKYLGENVEVKLFDGDIIQGYLRKTHDETLKNDPNLYLPLNYYFVTEIKDSATCNNYLFRSSHVRHISKNQNLQCN